MKTLDAYTQFGTLTLDLGETRLDLRLDYTHGPVAAILSATMRWNGTETAPYGTPPGVHRLHDRDTWDEAATIVAGGGQHKPVPSVDQLRCDVIRPLLVALVDRYIETIDKDTIEALHAKITDVIDRGTTPRSPLVPPTDADIFGGPS